MEKRIYHVESLQFKWYFKQNNTDCNVIYHLGVSWAEQRNRLELGTGRTCSTGCTSPPSVAMPWKPGSNQASLQLNKPSIICLLSTSKDTNWPSLVICFHSSSLPVHDASHRSFFPTLFHPPESSSQLISHTKPSSYKSTELSQRLTFHKQPHPSHFLSGVLWRILFILHLSWLYCKLSRTRTFHILCLHCWKHVASATRFRAVKARRDHCKYLSWPSAQRSNSRKWLLH